MGIDNRDPVIFRSPAVSDPEKYLCGQVFLKFGDGPLDRVRIHCCIERTGNEAADEFHLREQLALGSANQIRRIFPPARSVGQ